MKARDCSVVMQEWEAIRPGECYPKRREDNRRRQVWQMTQLARLDIPPRRAISGLPGIINPIIREGEMKAPSSRAQGDCSPRQSGLGRLRDVTCVVRHSP